jgi:uncharacterized membrane protein
MRAYRLLSVATVLLFVSVAGYAQEAPRTWVYEPTWSRDPGVTVVADPDALHGKALDCPATDKTWSGWYTFTTGYTMDYLPGEYEVHFRLKVADNKAPGAAFTVGVENSNAWTGVRWTDFKEPNKYQEFVYPFTIKTPVLNICCVRRYAGPQAWIDCVTVVRTKLYTETEQLAFGKFIRPANPTLQPHQGLHVWFAKGLYYQHYHINTVLEHMGATVDYAWVIRGQRGSALAGVPLEGVQPKQPEKPAPGAAAPAPNPYDVVLGYDLIVLCDTDAECLTVPQRAMIQDFVKAGGGLLIVGGPFSFGRGALDRSDLLEPLLPVTTAGEYDLRPLPAPAPLLPAQGKVMKTGLTWNSKPLVMWMHQTQPKPGATVELTAGGEPALVTWQYGNGRVAALTATVLGEPPAGSTEFWDWSDWPKLMAFVLIWLVPRR